MVDTKIYAAVTKSGVAELFQAVLDDKVLSSALVTMAEKGAYYYWAGTTKEGMKCGASHFLVHEITKTMQDRALSIFNLGGTDPSNKGLTEFKRGFGAEEVRLEAAEFLLGSRLKMKVARAFELLRENPTGFVRRMGRKLIEFRSGDEWTK